MLNLRVRKRYRLVLYIMWRVEVEELVMVGEMKE